MKYGVKMQSTVDLSYWATLPFHNTEAVDINTAFKHCADYNAVSASAPFGSIQRHTKYWVEEKL